MGNPFSAFSANFIISKFVTQIEGQLQHFTRIFLMYVNNVFATFDTKYSNIHDIILVLNNRSPSNKFTLEIEN